MTIDIKPVGKTNSAKNGRALRAIVLPMSKRANTEPLTKYSGEPGESKRLPDDQLSALASTGSVLEPPFDLLTLTMLPEHNTELGQCVEAMEVNIEGFGHRFVSRIDIDSADVPKDVANKVRAERVRLENFFTYANVEDSFIAMRRKRRRDLETTGNAYWEVIRNVRGEVQGFEYIPSYQINLGKIEESAIAVEVPILKLNDDGSVEVDRIPMRRRFRTYVQTRSLFSVTGSSVSDYRMVWFKELGDPRTYDNRTGEVVPPEKVKNWDGKGQMPEHLKANELVHWKLFTARSPYGIPRYIGNLLSIFGDRKAEEINFHTFENNCVPSMMLLVANGQITQGSIDRIQEYVDGQIKGSDNWSKFLIIEAESSEQDETGEESGLAKLHVERLRDQQQDDALFQNYSANNQDKIRRAFRLPPILVGRSDTYNRACYSADTQTLTENGWKFHNEIGPDEKIAAYNPMTGEMVFVKPTAKYVYDVDEELVHFSGRSTDILVTADHKIVARRNDGRHRTGDWSVHTAETIPWRQFDLPSAPTVWEGMEKSEFVLPQICNDRRNSHVHGPVRFDDWLEFLGYFLSEGGLVSPPHHLSKYSVILSQNEGPIADKMRSCLQRLGYRFSETTDKAGCVKFWISNQCLRAWLAENVGDSTVTKHVPHDYLQLSRRQLSILLEAMMLGDGTYDWRADRTSSSYSSSSSQLLDQVQQIALQLGIRSVIGPGTRSMRVSMSANNTVTLKDYKNVTHVRYRGEVYCFSVPEYGFFVTRRNGKVALQGNTAETSRKLADEQIFAPERTEFDSWVNRCLFPMMGVVFHKFKSNSPNTTDNMELVRILSGAEKTGGMTPRIARSLLGDILGDTELPEFPEGFQADMPFSLTMAEAVKNKADPTEPGQTVTAIKSMADRAEEAIERIEEYAREQEEAVK